MATIANRLIRILQGQIFHATSITGYQGILADQFIRHDRTSEGNTWNGQCKTLGCISVVDLRGQNKSSLNPSWGTSTWSEPLFLRKPCVILVLNNQETSKLIVKVPKGTVGWCQTHCEKCTSHLPFPLVEKIIIFKGFHRRFKVLNRRLLTSSEIANLIEYRDELTKEREDG